MLKTFKSIIKFISKWNEFITIPLALVLWYFSPLLLRWFDPTSATYDYGVFQIIIFTIIQFFFYTGVVWIYLKIAFPQMYKHLDDKLLEGLTNYEKTKMVVWLFSLLLLSLVILSRVL